MYFIEGYFILTLSGLSGRGVRTSERRATGTCERCMLIGFRMTCKRGALRALLLVAAIGEDILWLSGFTIKTLNIFFLLNIGM
jgi:hypothetical protein